VVSIILCQYQFAQFTLWALCIVWTLCMQCDCHCFFIKGYLTSWLDLTWQAHRSFKMVVIHCGADLCIGRFISNSMNKANLENGPRYYSHAWGRCYAVKTSIKSAMNYNSSAASAAYLVDSAPGQQCLLQTARRDCNFQRPLWPAASPTKYIVLTADNLCNLYCPATSASPSPPDSGIFDSWVHGLWCGPM